MRRGLFFYNTRTIEFACERCDGDGEQLVGAVFGFVAAIFLFVMAIV